MDVPATSVADERLRSEMEPMGGTVVSRGSVGIKVNDALSHYFQTRKGLRKGDLLSQILFNVVRDMLAILISRQKKMVRLMELYRTP